MKSRLTPRPSSLPWSELLLVGAASLALGACAANASHLDNRAPTCGPCCHGSHGPECQAQSTGEDEIAPDVTADDAMSGPSDASTASTDGTDASASTAVTDSGRTATPPAPTSGRRRGPGGGAPDRTAPTCGPECHGAGSGSAQEVQ